MESIVAGRGLVPDEPAHARGWTQPFAGAGFDIGRILIDDGRFRNRPGLPGRHARGRLGLGAARIRVDDESGDTDTEH